MSNTKQGVRERLEHLLRLVGLEGATANEAAEYLGCSVVAVRNHIDDYIWQPSRRDDRRGGPAYETRYYHPDYASAVSWMRLADAIDDMTGDEILAGLSMLDDESHRRLVAGMPLIGRVAASLEVETDHADTA